MVTPTISTNNNIYQYKAIIFSWFWHDLRCTDRLLSSFEILTDRSISDSSLWRGWIYTPGSRLGLLGVWLSFLVLISILGVCASVLAVFSAVSWEGCASSGCYATRAAYAAHGLQRPCMQRARAHTHTHTHTHSH